MVESRADWTTINTPERKLRKLSGEIKKRQVRKHTNVERNCSKFQKTHKSKENWPKIYGSKIDNTERILGNLDNDYDNNSSISETRRTLRIIDVY